MPARSTYWIYILANGHHGTLYLPKRLHQHRSGQGSQFVEKYKGHRLVHVEAFATSGGDRTGEAAEELATGLEGRTDRER
jgi:predicted GIY-YIG superfamily endonuclease